LTDDDTVHPEDEKEEESRGDLLADLRAITAVDRKRLLVSARFWWRRFRLQPRFVEPDDLLQEAVVRVLAKRRNLPDGVALPTFLSQTMRSIGSNTVAKNRGSDELHREVTALDRPPPLSETASRGGAPPAATSESRVAARDSLNKLDEFLANDPELRSVLELKAQGLKAAEIKAELGFDGKKWETVRKRAIRKLAQLEAQEKQDDPE
jgi:DNA-directed RNA polymerase specialized sigma24 family protein